MGTEQQKDDAAFDAAFADAVDGKPQAKGGAPVVVPEAKPDATVVVPEAKPDATVVVPEAKPDATVVAPEAKPDATVVAPEAKTVPKPAELTPEQKVEKEKQDKFIADIVNELVPPLTPEQEAKIAAVKKDFPDIVEVIEIERQRSIDKAVASAKKTLFESLNQVYQEFTPVVANSKAIAEERHFDAILKVHPDYDAIEPKIQAWIDTQPAYLQESYNKVYTKGNANEITDLVTRYKDSTGHVTPKVGEQSPAKVDVQPDPAAIQALTPIKSDRVQVSQRGVDVNDFDGAFNEAAALEEMRMKK